MLLRANRGPWTYYINTPTGFDKNKVGKWMVFFNAVTADHFVGICSAAVEFGAVKEAKHTQVEIAETMNSGVACFYMNYDDMESRKKCIQMMQKFNLIRKTKTGKYYNISFKLDRQTEAGEYGDDYKGTIKLSDFIDLKTGEWLADKNG